MINLSSDKQDDHLIEISKAVEYQTNQIKDSLNTNKFSKCLLDSAGLISLLKIEILTPSNYYLLFNDISDILQETLEYFIREIILKGIKIKYIYNSVQQSQFLIPRLYLMIITGSIYLEQDPLKYREILYDLLNMVKCVQSPLRAFWIRYFLFKSTKDKLPIKKGDYIDNKEYYSDYMKISINFLMENLEYMNHYTNRVLKEIYLDDLALPENERENMIECEKEIIEEISNIKGLTKTIVNNKIFPKLFEIIFDSGKDFSLQYILIDSIIKNFKIDLYYESQGIHLILFTISKLLAKKEIDVTTVFINLLNIYKKFIKSKKMNLEIKNEIINKIKDIYHLFLLKYNELQISYNNSGENELNKFIDLDISFMKFTFKVFTEKDGKRLKLINHIMDLCIKRIELNNHGFNTNTIKKIYSFIEVTLKKYNIYELPYFEKLIIYLDYNNRKEICLRIIESLIKTQNKNIYLDSIEKVQKLISLILPLKSEIKENNEENNFEYFDENEKNIYLCKLISILKSKKPEIMVEIFIKIKDFLISGSKQSTYFTIPSLISNIIIFINKIELYYKYKISNISEENNENKEEIINSFDIGDEIDKEKIKEYFVKLINDTINLLKECILIIKSESLEKAFKLDLLLFNQMNKINHIIDLDKNLFSKLFNYFFDDALKILKDENDSNIKYNLFLYLCGYLPFFTKLFEKDKIINVIDLLEKEMSKINDINLQFKILSTINDLNFLINKDKEKLKLYLDKCLLIAKNISESTEKNNLLIILINKILYFIEKDENCISVEVLNDIIKELKNNEILKENNNDYYKRTIDLINERKKLKNKNIYEMINI